MSSSRRPRQRPPPQKDFAGCRHSQARRGAAEVTSRFKRWNEETQGAARGFAISWMAEISHQLAASPCSEEKIWIPHPHIA